MSPPTRSLPNFSRPFPAAPGNGPDKNPPMLRSPAKDQKPEAQTRRTIMRQVLPRRSNQQSRVPVRLSKPNPHAHTIVNPPIPTRPSAPTSTASRPPVSHIPVPSNFQSQQPHPNCLTVGGPHQTRTVDRRSASPCSGPLSTIHRLKSCGHLVRTAEPSACGSSCSANVASGSPDVSDVLPPFACALCIQSLLDAKYAQKRKAFEAEMAGLEAFFGRAKEKEARLSVRERIWAKERAGDEGALKGLGRACEGVLDCGQVPCQGTKLRD